MKYLSPKNWVNFQHYKNRNPPWIKLHRSCLMDPAFLKLDVYGRATCPMLWILASSHHEGLIPFVIEDLAVVLRVSEADCQKELKPYWIRGYLKLLKSMLATCPQMLATCKQMFAKQFLEREKRRGEKRQRRERVEKRQTHARSWFPAPSQLP